MVSGAGTIRREDVEERLLWIGLFLLSLLLIFVIVSVYGVPNLNYLILMEALFGLAIISLYFAFKNYKLSKWKWFGYGLGYVVVGVIISQLVIRFDEVVSVTIAGLTWLSIVSVAEISKTIKSYD